ncbi:DUF6998 domain-containing protein [Lysinimonas soli]|uniref:DUF6998 domain-containing protein n=1 Tax=Lysinimonas soli TaxID=1074233 RepID=A0ABW0NL65_9MICO
MNPASISVRELADELAVSPKSIRAWMRKQNWRSVVEHGQPWLLSPSQVRELRGRFALEAADDEIVLAVADGDPLPGLSIGELLTTYRHVLASLRARGMVRTNNAPIGDLAEYCAAIVYDGLLAPNSEKSYDLVAEDGRRIQVKVRVIRSDTRPTAAFSPLRSFRFDAAVFLLVNDESGRVETAMELSAAEVQEVGKYREHTNGTVLRIGQIRRRSLGVDLTARFDEAWHEMLGLPGTM